MAAATNKLLGPLLNGGIGRKIRLVHSCILLPAHEKADRRRDATGELSGQRLPVYVHRDSEVFVGNFDIAQVCPNGHVANSETQRHADFNRPFCEKCGEKTLIACPACNRPIRGKYRAEGFITSNRFTPPSYCFACGKPFPWTERAIQAAIQLSVEEGNLQGDDAEQFKNAVGDIVRDTPATPVAVSRMRKLMGKIGPQAAQFVRDTLKDVVSESVKKAIWGQ
jgi:hypothetical protein